MRQILLSVFFPYFEQFPPCLGSGLSHFRDHVSYPTPQVTLQFFDLVQLLTLPSTKIIQKTIIIVNVLKIISSLPLKRKQVIGWFASNDFTKNVLILSLNRISWQNIVNENIILSY